MIDGRRVLAVVPARGGSKGVPLKNIRPVLGVPLIAMTGEIVRQVSLIDRAVVSTDHEEIARVAGAAGLEAPFLRPETLSGDRIGDLEVLTQALLASEAHYGETFDVVTMLQPTSPLRRAEHVTATIEKLVAENLDAVWTVSAADLKYHPFKLLVLNDGLLHLFDERGRAIIARQQLTPVYFRNGAAYAITRECLLEQKSIMGLRAGAVIVDEPMISIDTLEDFARVEAALQSR
jgi:CMP-N-acetylneuraminic acid synthetase